MIRALGHGFRTVVFGFCLLLPSVLYGQSISGFTLVDAEADVPLRTLAPTDTLNLNTLSPSSLSIRADANAASVRFDFAGEQNYQTENAAPYALNGNTGDDYWGVPELTTPGTYSLTATPYSEADASGTAGTPMSMTLHVSDELSTPPPDSCASDGVPLAIDGEHKRWHPVTVTFEGPCTSETAVPNPFLDYRLTVTFTHAATGTTVVVPGYFAADGRAAETSATAGTKWRAHFTPSLTGTWNFAASFREGPGVAILLDDAAGMPAAFDGASGTLTVAETDKTGRDHRGRGMLRYVGDPYLQFEDGTYFLKGGADSPETLLAYSEFDGTYNAGGGDNVRAYLPHVDDWSPGDPTWQDGKGKGLIGALNYLASEGMNAFSFITMNVHGDGQDVWPWIRPGAVTRPDVSKLAQWEIVMTHADRLGLFKHFKTQETENDLYLDGGDLGTERKLYYRELIARFGHHHALNWNLGEEYDAWEEKGDVDQSRLMEYADYIRALDPYDHPIVVHTFPNDDDIYGGLLGVDSFDGPSVQLANMSHTSANQTVVRWRTESAQAGRPWNVSIDEPGDWRAGLQPDATNNHEEAREVMWATFFGGGDGLEWYFGWDSLNNDLNADDWRSRDQFWDFHRIALDFMHTLPFGSMTADNALLDGEPGYVFSSGADTLAVYLPDGGTSATLALPAGTFDVRWLDVRTGGPLQTGTIAQVEGGTTVPLGAPPAEGDEDWVVLVTRQPAPDPAPETPPARYAFRVDGDQTLVELEGNGPDGQLGATPAADVSDPTWTDSGLTFDGTDDYVTFGDAFDVGPSGAQTILVQFRAEATTDPHYLFAKRSTWDGDMFYYLRVQDGQLRAEAKQADGSEAFDVTGEMIEAGETYVAHLVIDNVVGVVRVGLDGTDVVTATFEPGQDLSGTVETTIGAMVVAGTPHNVFGGTIAHVQVYDRALTTQDLQEVVGDIATPPALEARPSNLAFGLVESGTTSDVQTVTLANDTTIAAEIIGFELVGTDASAFAVTSTVVLPTTLSVGEELSVDVVFTPTSEGSKRAVLTTTYDGGSRVDVGLRGHVVASTVDPGPPSGRYDFEADGDQTLVELEGTGPDGQLGATPAADASDPTWTDGGLTFDGTDDYVTFGDAFDIGPAESQTVVVAFRVATSTGKQDLFAKRSTVGPPFYYLRVQDGTLRAEAKEMDGVKAFDLSGGEVTTGETHVAHLVIDNVAGTVRLGLSGRDVQTATYPSGTDLSSGALAQLGALVVNGATLNELEGTMSHLRVYDQALNSDELAVVVSDLTGEVSTLTSARVSAPLVLQNLDASPSTGRSMTLRWNLASPTIPPMFVVERRRVEASGVAFSPWETIDRVPAARTAAKVGDEANSGTGALQPHIYTDASLGALPADTDRVQYRVQMLAEDGRTGISPTIEVTVPVASFQVHGNYPNPFRSRTTVAFDLPTADHVDLRVFDLMGRQVAHVIDKDLSAGRHRVPVTLSQLAPGMYFGRLLYAGHVRVMKWVVLD